MFDAFYFQCSECGATWQLDSNLSVCPECSRQRKTGEPLRGVLTVQLQEKQFTGLRRPVLLHDTAELAPLLPLRETRSLPQLAMPVAPLYPVTVDRAGKHHLLLKDDTRQPTGSYKDRASMLVVANARERGCDTICAASTGNAGSSLACLAAASGLRSVVLVPAEAPPAKLSQAVAYGATLLPIDGSYDDAYELSLELEQITGWINRNTAWNPYTIEGKKTAAIEIAWQMKWQVPDLLFVPAGDGVIISGLYKGFLDCLQLGWIERIPRLIAVQAEGSSVLVDSLQNPELRLRPGCSTIADSICVDAPRNLHLARQAIENSGGEGVTVSDQEIMEGVRELAGLSGVFAEPAAAAAWAGAVKWLSQAEQLYTAVIMITGSGLKAADRLTSSRELPEPIAPEIDQVMSSLRNEIKIV